MLKMVLKMFGGGLEDGHEMVMIEWTAERHFLAQCFTLLSRFKSFFTILLEISMSPKSKDYR